MYLKRQLILFRTQSKKIKRQSNKTGLQESVDQPCSVAMPQHVPQSLPNPPCVECLLINSLSLYLQTMPI